MAAFQFPDPAVTQTVTNPITGSTYQWKADPGKWVLTVANQDETYVNKTGDTMTGPLRIFTDDVNPAGNLSLKSTSLANKNLNHLIYCESTNGSPLFGITNDGFTTTHHNLQCTSSPAFFTSGGSPNDTPGYCAFSILGPAVGDTDNVPYPNRLSPILKTWYNFDGTGTAVRYFGMQVDDNDIVNKAYVDATNITSGGIINANGGSVDTSGNLTIKQSASDSQDGRIYLKGSDNTSNISMYGAGGGIDMKGNLSFNSTNNNKNIRAYGSSSPIIKFLTGTEAGNAQERLSINASAVTSNVNLISNYGIAGQNISASGQVSAGTNLLVGTTSTLNGNVTAGADLSVAGTTTLGPAIALTDQGTTTITGGGSSLNYLLNSKGTYFYKGLSNSASDLMFTLNGDQNSTSYGVKAWDKFTTVGDTVDLNSQVTIEAPNQNYLPGLAIKTTNNNTTLWNATQPGHLRFQTTAGNNGGTCGIQVQGDSSSPSFMMTLGAPGYSLERVFSYSYSATYGKRIYIYPDWGSSYSNAVNLPDQTPVTLGYLRANGLVTIASTTSTQEADDPSGTEHGIISAQTDVTVPSQMTLSADTAGGQGFTLKGKTVADPSSHNGDVLKTTHAASNTAAELEYFGSTAGANSVQTKESVEALITTAVPAETWDFFNSSSAGTNSTLDGYWNVQWSYTATQGQVIVKAKNDSTNIANGTVVCTMPAASRPNSVAVIRLASREGTTTADAVFSALDGNITIQNVQGVGSDRLEGMLIYPIHAA